MVLSMFTIGGVLAGAIFGLAFKLLKNYTLPAAFLLLSAGMACVVYGNSMIMLIMGTCLAGIGSSLATAAMLMMIGSIVPSAGQGIITGILMTLVNLGSFLATYYIVLVANISGSTDVKLPIFYAMVGFLVLAAIYGIMGWNKRF
ncbi:hypothetical protein [Desulfitobacterium hafniense]|nr:hypothetical protein [Desulfitobacterium hafniense]